MATPRFLVRVPANRERLWLQAIADVWGISSIEVQDAGVFEPPHPSGTFDLRRPVELLGELHSLHFQVSEAIDIYSAGDCEPSQFDGAFDRLQPAEEGVAGEPAERLSLSVQTSDESLPSQSGGLVSSCTAKCVNALTTATAGLRGGCDFFDLTTEDKFDDVKGPAGTATRVSSDSESSQCGVFASSGRAELVMVLLTAILGSQGSHDLFCTTAEGENNDSMGPADDAIPKRVLRLASALERAELVEALEGRFGAAVTASTSGSPCFDGGSPGTASSALLSPEHLPRPPEDDVHSNRSSCTSSRVAQSSRAEMSTYSVDESVPGDDEEPTGSTGKCLLSTREEGFNDEVFSARGVLSPAHNLVWADETELGWRTPGMPSANCPYGTAEFSRRFCTCDCDEPLPRSGICSGCGWKWSGKRSRRGRPTPRSSPVVQRQLADSDEERRIDEAVDRSLGIMR